MPITGKPRLQVQVCHSAFRWFPVICFPVRGSQYRTSYAAQFAWSSFESARQSMWFTVALCPVHRETCA